MIVTPGPALVVIPVGLAILSIEFTFARRWLKRLRESISSRNSRDLGERAEAHRDGHRHCARRLLDALRRDRA
ncbi:MAG: PGPGW domain-containing protein [Woeseiaceae bacterium]